MIVHRVDFFSYSVPFVGRENRRGVWIQIVDHNNNTGWGEIAPLPGWSSETLEDVIFQLKEVKKELFSRSWTKENCLQQILQLDLFPSVAFGVESALLSLLDPISDSSIVTSALVMGSFEEMLNQIEQREQEGYQTLKVKIGTLSCHKAETLISRLIDRFKIRVDVNRNWKTEDSLSFFSQFHSSTFEYVEEPFKDPKDLKKFPLPLAVDESFPKDLSLEELEQLSALKTLIYKPSLQGGMAYCLPLYQWASKRGIDIVISSSFENSIGLYAAFSLSERLSLQRIPGLGTHFFIEPTPIKEVCAEKIRNKILAVS